MGNMVRLPSNYFPAMHFCCGFYSVLRFFFSLIISNNVGMIIWMNCKKMNEWKLHITLNNHIVISLMRWWGKNNLYVNSFLWEITTEKNYQSGSRGEGRVLMGNALSWICIFFSHNYKKLMMKITVGLVKRYTKWICLGIEKCTGATFVTIFCSPTFFDFPFLM